MSFLNALNIECRFHKYSNYYACETFANFIRTENETLKFCGDHYRGLSDTNVDLFSFYESNISYLPENMFYIFPNIKKLHCNACMLRALSQCSFKNARKLKYFYARRGNIEKLSENTFIYSPNIEDLRLDAHMIEVIEENAFNGLKNLKILDLYHNFIKIIDETSFKPLVNLEELWLSNNKIQVLSPRTFQSNTKLKKLYLTRNRISIIDSKLLHNLHKIEVINLSFNDCTSFLLTGKSFAIQEQFKKNTSKCSEKHLIDYKLKSSIAKVIEKESEIQILALENVEMRTTIQIHESKIKHLERVKLEIEYLKKSITIIKTKIDDLCTSIETIF